MNRPQHRGARDARIDLDSLPTEDSRGGWVRCATAGTGHVWAGVVAAIRPPAPDGEAIPLVDSTAVIVAVVIKA